MRTISLFTHISLLCWGSFWILNRSDCYELYIKTVKLTLIVVFLHEEKQLIASFESLVSALIHSKRPKATFCGFLVSWGQTNKLCEEFSNTVGSDSALYFNSDFPKQRWETCGDWFDTALRCYRLRCSGPWLMPYAGCLRHWGPQADRY